MEQGKRKRNPIDYSSKIIVELDQLIALGELLRQMPTPAETRNEFFPGLADLIAEGADRIKEMLDPMYDYLLEGGMSGELARRDIAVNS